MLTTSSRLAPLGRKEAPAGRPAILWRVIFWFFAAAFAWSMLGQPALGGSDTCATEGQVLETSTPTGTHITVSGSGDAWSGAGGVRIYFDDELGGDASSYSGESVLPEGTLEVELRCGTLTGSADWTITYSTPDAITCAPDCTSTDVVRGLDQISSQLHGLSVYLVVVLGFLAAFAIVGLSLFWAVLRRG